MSDVASEMQAAVVAALKAAGVAGGRIYDRVPPNAAFPYVAIGEIQIVDDGADCIEAVEVFVTLHVWSRSEDAVGKPETHRLQGAIRNALHRTDPALATWRLVEMTVRDQRQMDDPDGVTVHGITTLRALVDPA